MGVIRVHRDFELWLDDVGKDIEKITGKRVTSTELTHIMAKAQVNPITIVDKTRKRRKEAEFDIW